MIIGLIKVVSTIVISVAIALTTWDLTLGIDWGTWPGWCHVGFWYSQGAAAIHLLEGIAAAIWVAKRAEHQPLIYPLAYGIYTFFVGTVGLQELWETREKVAEI